MGQKRYKVYRILRDEDGGITARIDTGNVVSIRDEHAAINNEAKEYTEKEYHLESESVELEYETCSHCGGTGRVLKQDEVEGVGDIIHDLPDPPDEGEVGEVGEVVEGEIIIPR